MTQQSFISIVVLTWSLFFFLTASASGQNSKSDTIQEQKPKNYKHSYIKYPPLAREFNIQGTVIVSYDIDSTCNLVNRKIVQGLGYGCNEEVLKLLDRFQTNLKKEEKGKCKAIKNETDSIRFKLQ